MTTIAAIGLSLGLLPCLLWVSRYRATRAARRDWHMRLEPWAERHLAFADDKLRGGVRLSARIYERAEELWDLGDRRRAEECLTSGWRFAGTTISAAERALRIVDLLCVLAPVVPAAPARNLPGFRLAVAAPLALLARTSDRVLADPRDVLRCRAWLLRCALRVLSRALSAQGRPPQWEAIRQASGDLTLAANETLACLRLALLADSATPGTGPAAPSDSAEASLAERERP